MRTICVTILAAAMFAVTAFADAAGMEQRVEAVLSRLTLEQKIGQTWQCLGREMVEPASGDMSGETAHVEIRLPVVRHSCDFRRDHPRQNSTDARG